MVALNQVKDDRINQTIGWLQKKVSEANAQGLIVGVSGGIDSAVAANLIKRAFPQRSMGLIIPINSHNQDVEDGIAVVKTAGLSHAVLDLTQEHQSMMIKVMNVLSEEKNISAESQRLSDANLRARIRMSALYAIANALNYMVVGTDNAAELYTGYFTKYGDGGVDLLPLGKLLKSEVVQWAKELGVPEQVIKRPPSAGLWEGQTDEAEMGITYDAIDAFLSGNQISDENYARLQSMHEKTEHKRKLPPLPEY